MEKVARKFNSFAEAEQADKEYYLSLTPQERMEILLSLIEQAQTDETAKGFTRVCRIVKLHES